MIFAIRYDNGLRLGINLLDVLAMEEVNPKDAPCDELGLPDTHRLLRLFLRNGASFTVVDKDETLFDDINNYLKFGDTDQGDYSDAAS